MSSVPLIKLMSPEARKRRRIERELRALHAMRSHLNTWELVCAVLTIPALIIVCLLVAWKLHWLSDSPLLAILGAVATGIVIWAMGRRWFGLALLLVFALLLLLCAVMFEEVPDVSPDLSFDFSSDDKPRDRKTRRRIKLEQAIAKREAMLRSLQGKS
jgi:hypothetical protein